MTRRVVITGMGTVNSLASDLRGYWEALCAGRSGVGLIEQFDTRNHKVKIAGEPVNEWPEPNALDDPADRDETAFQCLGQPVHREEQALGRASLASLISR